MKHHPHYQYDDSVVDESDEIDLRPPSKSQRKRDMDALQNLGKELCNLPTDRLKKLDMPERLREALLDWQRFTKHEAKRRQLQFIGKLMRDVDVEPLQEALDIMKGVSAQENARIHRWEQLRQQLMDDEAALGDIAELYPRANLQHLRQLRRNALKEAEQQKPPRAFREIFRQLRLLDEQTTPPESEPLDSEDEQEEN